MAKINGTKNDDKKLKGTNDDDTIVGKAGNDQLDGKGGNDLLKAGDGNDKAWGGDDDDTILGGSGNDKLWGQAGDDLLDGGSGKDKLDGGEGINELTGGSGADKFYFLDVGRTTVTDAKLSDGDKLYISKQFLGEDPDGNPITTVEDFIINRAAPSDNDIHIDLSLGNGDDDKQIILHDVDINDLASMIILA